MGFTTSVTTALLDPIAVGLVYTSTLVASLKHEIGSIIYDFL